MIRSSMRLCTAALLAVVSAVGSTSVHAQTLPAGWNTADIGAVAAAGSATGTGSSFSVRGSGDDVWNTADAFRFVHRTLTGDGTLVAQVTSVEYVHAWTKAGVMIRESLAANARHATMLVSPGKGLAFQRRVSTGGVSTHTSGGGGTAPAYVRIRRTSNTFTAATSTDGTNWATVGTETIAMGPTVFVGLAVTSHHNGVLAAASFADVSLTLPAGDSPLSSTSTGSLPSGWASADVGSVGANGQTQASSSSSFALRGAGADIWGAADAFQFAYRTLTGDGTIVTQVSALDHVNPWTKGGVMMRETLQAGSRHASMLVTASMGLAFQRRPSTGGQSEHTAGASATPPYFVRLARQGNTFTAAYSRDGAAWTTVGSETIAMGSTIYVGLALTSHEYGTLTSGSFSQLGVAAGTSTAASAPSTTSGALRVLHWNIHHGVGTDGVYDLDRLATWMVTMTPDVISLNEVERFTSWGNEDQPARFAALLKAKTGKTWYYHFAQRSGSWSSNGQGNLVLSRFPLTLTGQLALSCNRSVALAGVSVNGRQVNVTSTHLDDESSSCRTSQVTEILAWFRNFPEARIMAGDWNAQATDWHVTKTTETYVDAWAAAANAGIAIDYPGNTRFGATRNSRIDYVFHSRTASALVLQSAQVYDTRASNGHMPSDHKPLVVTYGVK